MATPVSLAQGVASNDKTLSQSAGGPHGAVRNTRIISVWGTGGTELLLNFMMIANLRICQEPVLRDLCCHSPVNSVFPEASRGFVEKWYGR